MSVGVDALLLVALCGTASWLLQRRRRRRMQAAAPMLPAHAADGIWALQTGAVLCQAAQVGQPAQDWLVTEVVEPSRGSPIALLGLLDGGGQDEQALLVVLADQKAVPEDERQVWLVRCLPAQPTPQPAATEPPRQRQHEHITYQQGNDWQGLVRTRTSARSTEHDDCRITLYVGPGTQRMAWLQRGSSHAWYAGHTLALRDIELLPA